ncbi:HlyD family efflux transporter periplasmic adaptor subunit [Azospira restricta]|nr:HlyD family efflux transporter periplasmic adaptor subunit [Azospira restricta]
MMNENADPADWQIPDGAPFSLPRQLRWEAFVTAKTAEEKCRAWLDLICGRVPDATAAAVLVESVEAKTFVPVAVWPNVSPDLGRLGPVVERALRERSGVVQPGGEGGDVLHIAYPLMLGNRVDGVVVIESACNDEDVELILREIHWGSAWLANLLGARELEEALQGRERLSGVLEATAVALRQGSFQQTLFEVASDLRMRLGCSRVAIGLVKDMGVSLAVLSDAATFERNTPLVKAYMAAMEEAFDAGKPVCAAGESPEDAADARKAAAQRRLVALAGARHVLSFPLSLGAECVAVLTMERAEDKAFAPPEFVWLEALAAMLAPVIRQRVCAERSAFGRARDECRKLLERFFGPRHLVWKAVGSAVLFVVAMLVLVPIEYRVTAKAVIEGEVQRVVAAPFDGFVGASLARAGDTVKKGQPLAALDDRDLRIEQERWASERDQYDKKLREAMANHDLTAVQVVGAQFRQAGAQWALVTEKIERASLVAPFDGIVVSGDLSQQIGAPVETGKKLFEVAPLQTYRVILQVDEREIRHLADAQPGQVVIAGIAGDAMPLKVTKVTPVATAQDGKNFFRVEAQLDHPVDRLRPGMEGVGKVEVGSRSLWWILTHSFSDWLILTLWTWMP